MGCTIESFISYYEAIKKQPLRAVLYMVPEAGLEPARVIRPRDFKSLVSTCSTTPANIANLEATPGFEPGNKDFADPRLTAWLCRHLKKMERETGVEPATSTLAR